NHLNYDDPIPQSRETRRTARRAVAALSGGGGRHDGNRLVAPESDEAGDAPRRARCAALALPEPRRGGKTTAPGRAAAWRAVATCPVEVGRRRKRRRQAAARGKEPPHRQPLFFPPVCPESASSRGISEFGANRKEKKTRSSCVRNPGYPNAFAA